LAAEDHVRISDFGVSHQGSEDVESDVSLAKTAGTPAFFAPELCAGSSAPTAPITKAIDIWALGVTLYCFIYGNIPFQAENHFDLYQAILNNPVAFEEDSEVSESLKDLLHRMLEKDPEKRITLSEIKDHPWTLEGLADPRAWQDSNNLANREAIHITLDEVKQAVTLFGKFKRGIRRLSVTLTRGKTRTRSMDFDSESTSSVSSGLSNKRPSISSLEVPNAATPSPNPGASPSHSDDSLAAHFRPPSSNSHFRPSIRSSMSQEFGESSNGDQSGTAVPRSPRLGLRDSEGAKRLSWTPESPTRLSPKKVDKNGKPRPF